MMAQSMHLPNIARHPDIELICCCDTDPARLTEAKERFHPRGLTADAREVAEDDECEIVLIAASHSTRLELVELFARAGKHIYLEKPMAESLDELRQVLSIVEETGIALTVGHNRRMAPAVYEARRILEKHRSGPIAPGWRWNRDGVGPEDLPGQNRTMALLRVNDDFWSWKRWAFAAGALLNEMTHFADLAGVFMVSAPVRVTTTGSRSGNHVVTIEYADGSIATIFATAFGSFGYPKELLEIYHNGAAVIVDHLAEVRTAGVVDEPFRTVFPVPGSCGGGIEAYYQAIHRAQQDAERSGDNSILPPQPDKGHFALLSDLVEAVRDGRDPVSSAKVAAVATAVVLRAAESEARGGVPVEIRPDDYSPASRRRSSA